MSYEEIEPCPECGAYFENVFDATDHTVEDDGDEVFDPKLTIGSGYTLMVGSLLRCLYSHADDPAEIKSITQSVYATLYAAETDPGYMKDIIEDMVVHANMYNFDNALNDLLDSEKPNDAKGGE